MECMHDGRTMDLDHTDVIDQDTVINYYCCEKCYVACEQTVRSGKITREAWYEA